MPSFRPFTDDEAQGTALFIFEHSVILGLLQTEEYARALLASYPGAGEAEVAGRVAGRMARQAMLQREDPPA